MFSSSDRSSAEELGVLHGQTDSRVPNTGLIVSTNLFCCVSLFYLFLYKCWVYINLLQVAGIKTAISLKEKVCKIMNKTYGRCFRSFAIETLFWIIIVGWFTHLASQQETRATSIPKQWSSSGEKIVLTSIWQQYSQGGSPSVPRTRSSRLLDGRLPGAAFPPHSIFLILHNNHWASFNICCIHCILPFWHSSQSNLRCTTDWMPNFCTFKKNKEIPSVLCFLVS